MRINLFPNKGRREHTQDGKTGGDTPPLVSVFPNKARYECAQDGKTALDMEKPGWSDETTIDSVLEKNISIKAEMVKELKEIGLPLKAIERVLHLDSEKLNSLLKQ